MTTHRTDQQNLLDAAVDAFEASLASGRLSPIRNFLPERNAPAYEAILLELIRVDLERSWNCGECRNTEDYCLDFPDVLTDADYRSLVAYEEFRVRKHAGMPIEPAVLEARLAISPKLAARTERQRIRHRQQFLANAGETASCRGDAEPGGRRFRNFA
ncbi:MAG: hypothetical protein R3C49_18220 [Planctomycetaceae bacterium]